jgi:CBS domain-containing protein
MTTQLRAPRASQTALEAARVAAGTRHDQYPVVQEEGRLVGVLYARELDAAVLAGRLEDTAGSLARAPALLLTPELTLSEAALRLAKAGVTRAPVVESLGSGLLVGFLSSSDLVRARLLVNEEEEAGPQMTDLG